MLDPILPTFQLKNAVTFEIKLNNKSGRENQRKSW